YHLLLLHVPSTTPISTLSLHDALPISEKVPKPTKVSLSPFFNVLLTPSKNESRAAPAWTLVMPASSAILVTSSALFISDLLINTGAQSYTLFDLNQSF